MLLLEYRLYYCAKLPDEHFSSFIDGIQYGNKRIVNILCMCEWNGVGVYNQFYAVWVMMYAYKQFRHF